MKRPMNGSMRAKAALAGKWALTLALAGCAGTPPAAFTPLPQCPIDVRLNDLARLLRLEISQGPDYWRLAGAGHEVRIYPGLSMVWMDGEFVPLDAPIRLAEGVPLIPEPLAESIRMRSSVPGRSPVMPLPGASLKIVIDPGHGGKFTGTISPSGVQEKDVVLDISLEVSRLLQEAGCSVILTRDRDTELSESLTADLRERAEAANRADADLFVSIHANAKHPDGPDRRGLEVYYPTEAFRVQVAEECSDPCSRAEIRRSTADSQTLARSVHDAIVGDLSVDSYGIRQHPKRLAVLRLTRCPAILVETGYLTDPREEAQLKDPAHRKALAKSIAAGILAHWSRCRAEAAR